MRVKRVEILGAAAAGCLLAAAQAASAGVTTVDISSLYNGTWGGNQGVWGAPKGDVDLNGAPFHIGVGGDGSAEYAVMSGGDNVISTDIYGATKIYTLFNTFWGQSGPNSYLSVTFNGSGGATETFHLVGGVDVRDFNSFNWTNTINGTTTKNVWTNGQQRLDEQTFTLDPAFKTQTLTSIVIDDTGGSNFQRGVLTGVSVAAVPEPATWTMLILGLGMIGFAARRRNEGSAVAA